MLCLLMYVRICYVSLFYVAGTENGRAKRWSCFLICLLGLSILYTSPRIFSTRGMKVPWFRSLRICLEHANFEEKNKIIVCFSYSAHVNYFSSTSSRSTFSFSYYFLSYFWFMRHMLCAPLLRFLLRMLLKMSRDPC